MSSNINIFLHGSFLLLLPIARLPCGHVPQLEEEDFSAAAATRPSSSARRRPSTFSPSGGKKETKLKLLLSEAVHVLFVPMLLFEYFSHYVSNLNDDAFYLKNSINKTIICFCYIYIYKLYTM